MSVTSKPGALDHRQHLRKGRDIAAREDIFCNPGIGDAWTFRAADGMQDHHTVIGEQLSRIFEKGIVVIDPDMLEHSNRDDAIERRLQTSR